MSVRSWFVLDGRTHAAVGDLALPWGLQAMLTDQTSRSEREDGDAIANNVSNESA